MAAHQIVEQIYKYRMRTDSYDTQPQPSRGKGEEVSPKMLEVSARQHFVETCKAIYSEAFAAELGKEDALSAGELEALETSSDEAQRLLSAHIQTELYGYPTAKEGAMEGGGIDDLVSQMPIEAYVATRVRGTAHLARTRATHLARLSRGLHTLSLGAFLLGAAAAALGVAMRSSLAAAVPMCVLLNWVTDAIADYLHLPAQLAATNKALKDLNNLLQRWDSLSLLQRKARSTKLMCVQTVESATLAMCSARTALSAARKEEEEEEEEE